MCLWAHGAKKGLEWSGQWAKFVFVKPIIIAVDGYSATGKSTTAKRVADILGYTFIDTGAMYRAVTLYLLENGVDFHRESPELLQALECIHLKFVMNSNTGKRDIFLNDRNVEQAIREMRVSAVVSEVSTLSSVRRRLVALQQQMGKEGGIVMDGRDIGTVVFPNAELKVFLTAKMDTRVKRRLAEIAKSGGKTEEESAVRQNLQHRDHIDSTRADSPLRKAQDAIEIDTSNLTIPEQTELVVTMARQILERQSA
jgi:cytidylate kinase